MSRMTEFKLSNFAENSVTLEPRRPFPKCPKVVFGKLATDQARRDQQKYEARVKVCF